MKKCPKCKQTKSKKEFYFNKKSGKFLSWCSQCTKQRASESRRQLASSNDPEKNLQYSIYNLMTSIRMHFKKGKPIPHNITLKDLNDLYEKQKGKCYYTGTLMLLNSSKVKNRHPLKISVDRIDSNQGYTVDNTVLCCLGINSLKSISTPSEMYSALETFYKNSKSIGKL